MDTLSLTELEFLQQFVNWTGPRSDIRELLSISDLFVLPSAYREGIPRVLLEAAAMGLPLVATDAPGCREIVFTGQNGNLAQPGDIADLTTKINALIQDPILRHKFGVKSRQFAVDTFDLSIVSQKLDKLYKQLLSNRSSLDAPVDLISTQLSVD